MRFLIVLIRNIGEITIFGIRILYYSIFPPYRLKLILREFEFTGVQSLPIIFLVAFFTGMVFSLHSIRAFSIFRAEELVGPSVALALARELASILTALMVIGRVGSAYSSQIGAMKVTEQIDAIFVMGINPQKYIISPKVIALSLSMPLLYIFFFAFGIFGGIISAMISGISAEIFLKEVGTFLKLRDFLVGMLKSSVFGINIAVISSYFGFKAEKGAEEIGKLSTSAIVLSSVSTFFLNYFLSTLFYKV